MKRLIAICVGVMMFGMSYASAGTWTTIDAPGASSTSIEGISGNNLVGYYESPHGEHHGFIYNLTNQSWTTLDKTGADWTIINGLDGNNLVGNYGGKSVGYHAFLYNMTTQTWTTLDKPGAIYTGVYGIDGSNIVGEYVSGGSHGFLYNMTTQTWTTYDVPGASDTWILGISGNSLVGCSFDDSGNPYPHGFLYNRTSQIWTTLNAPGAFYTYVSGIDGNNIVGDYASGDTYGFLYNTTSQIWTTLNAPGADWTHIYDIDGARLIGVYGSNDTPDSHGFIYTVPKPALAVAVDIKPGSCPNPLNVKSKGVLPVAVLGSEDFDVNTIDIASIQLVGVSAIRSSYDDILTSAQSCTCDGAVGPDGYPELIVKFEIEAILEALGKVNDGDEIELTLTGLLYDETPIEGMDCILITVLVEETEVPDGMVWVYIDDPGVPGHEPFNGEMSKYETTNAQYCQFLNAALASGDITVSGSYVMSTSGPSSGRDYYRLDGSGINYDGAINGGAARINYSGGVFTVDNGFEDHPVTYVSWYGSTAFASYYGWRLPTEWEWQAVADYDGSYIYGCGPSINNSIANYYCSTHWDGTTFVGSFGTYGYGMCDMAGNVLEWTSTVSGSSSVLRGGSWYACPYYHCSVSVRFNALSYYMNGSDGFRVCR